MSKKTNPNNCQTCKHRPDPGGTGWCYMFRDEPQEICMQHTARKSPMSNAEVYDGSFSISPRSELARTIDQVTRLAE